MTYTSWTVSLSVCTSVRPKTLTLAITFAILKIATWYWVCMCISWSCTFWVVKVQGQGHPSRSKVKVKVFFFSKLHPQPSVCTHSAVLLSKFLRPWIHSILVLFSRRFICFDSIYIFHYYLQTRCVCETLCPLLSDFDP